MKKKSKMKCFIANDRAIFANVLTSDCWLKHVIKNIYLFTENVDYVVKTVVISPTTINIIGTFIWLYKFSFDK